MLRIAPQSLMVVIAAITMPLSALADTPGPDGYYQTGLAVHTTAGEHDYTTVHELKELPAQRTPQAIIDAETRKRFVISTFQDVPCSTFSGFLRTGLLREGMLQADVERLANVCSVPSVKKGRRIVVAYDPATTVTTLSIEKVGTASVAGHSAMVRVWKVWFGASASSTDRAGLSSRR